MLLRCILVIAAFLIFPHIVHAQEDDSLICHRLLSIAVEQKLADAPIGDIITAVGKQLIGTPYEAHTLDRQMSEQLTTNLHSFDCVTFLENVWALSRCVKQHRTAFAEYQEELKKIRYRSGTINGFASRLHYFSEWILDNEKRGIIVDMTRQLGGIPYHPKINFMSTHRNAYPQLVEQTIYEEIRHVERSLDTLKLFFIPKSQITTLQSKIISGDIIAITTSIRGLDVSHSGIAVRTDDGTLHYLHAPDLGERVMITKETLSQYVQRHPSQTGIMVLRGTEPPLPAEKPHKD